MELGLFQLENLFLNPSRFLFFDLRAESDQQSPVANEVGGLLKKAERIVSENVEEQLRSRKIPVEFPVVLVCADGRSSARLADQLERAGFTNVYVVAGGVAGLLAEL